jgi:hypothetical protein
MGDVVQDKTDDDNETDNVNDVVHCTFLFKLVTKLFWHSRLAHAHCVLGLNLQGPLLQLFGKLRDFAAMLLEIGREVRALGQSKPHAFDLEIGEDVFTGIALAHAKGNFQRGRFSARLDDFGFHDRIVCGALDSARHAYRLPTIIVEAALIDHSYEIREGGIETGKIGLRSAAGIESEREQAGSLCIGYGTQEVTKLALALTRVEQGIGQERVAFFDTRLDEGCGGVRGACFERECQDRDRNGKEDKAHQEADALLAPDCEAPADTSVNVLRIPASARWCVCAHG